MYLVLFLYIATFFTLTLGEFGQYPFGQTSFSISAADILLTLNLTVLLFWNIGIKRNLEIPKNFLWLTAFWAVAFLSLLVSLNLSGWLYLIRFIVYTSSFYLTYHLVKSKILSSDEFFRLVKVSCLLIAVLGLMQFILYPDLEPLSAYGYDPHKSRLFSTFLDPNFAGTFLSFGLLVAVYQLLNAKFTKNYIVENKYNLVYLAVMSISVILTFSRSGYLMVFSGLFIMLLLRKKLLLIPLFLIPLLLYLMYPPFATRIEGGINIDKSASERFSSWDKGLIIFQNYPVFGTGFNNVRQASAKFDLLKTYSVDGGNSGAGIDSSLIFIMATTGIVGLVSFGAFLGRVFYEFIKKTVQGKRGLLSLMLALFAGLILNSFFINSLFFPAVLFLWFSLIGLYYGLGEGEGEGS